MAEARVPRVKPGLESLVSDARLYLRVRPCSLRVAVRLYTAFLVGLICRLVLPSKFTTIGQFLPGKGTLTVRLDGFVAIARPRTEDLGVLALTQEPTVSDWLRPLPGQLVVDVGAHIGTYVVRAAKAGARVIALEPHPETFLVLKVNVELNGVGGLVTLLNLAASKEAEESRLFFDDGHFARASLDIPEADHFVSVRCDTLDRLLPPHAYPTIDWLKVDVEGHEAAALEGALSTLTRTSNIIIEVNDSNASKCYSILVDRLKFRILRRAASFDLEYWLLSRSAPSAAQIRKGAGTSSASDEPD
jgi:FkbM family methyltransferase